MDQFIFMYFCYLSNKDKQLPYQFVAKRIQIFYLLIFDDFILIPLFIFCALILFNTCTSNMTCLNGEYIILKTQFYTEPQMLL